MAKLPKSAILLSRQERNSGVAGGVAQDVKWGRSGAVDRRHLLVLGPRPSGKDRRENEHDIDALTYPHDQPAQHLIRHRSEAKRMRTAHVEHVEHRFG